MSNKRISGFCKVGSKLKARVSFAVVEKENFSDFERRELSFYSHLVICAICSDYILEHPHERLFSLAK